MAKSAESDHEEELGTTGAEADSGVSDIAEDDAEYLLSDLEPEAEQGLDDETDAESDAHIEQDSEEGAKDRDPPGTHTIGYLSNG